MGFELHARGAGASRSDGSARVRLAVALAGCYAILAGAATLVGWIADARRLTDWSASGISMLPNAAVASVAAGGALVLLAAGRRWAGAVLGMLVGLIGASTLFQHITGINLGIDGLLLFQEWGTGGTIAPGRMGPPASSSFTVMGTALVLSAFGKNARRVAVVAGLVTVAISMLSIIGYLYGASMLYSAPRLTAIAVPTSTVLLTLGMGLVVWAHDVGPMRLFREDSAGGMLVRRILPLIILLPILVGFLRVRGERLGHYDSAFGASLRTLIEVGLLAGLLWWAAITVRRHERARLRSERALRASEANYERLLGLMPAAVYACDASGRITYFNHHAADLWGRSPRIGETDERFCGSLKLITPDGRVLPHAECPMAVAIGKGRSFRNEDVIIERPDGRRINVLVNIEPMREPDGEVVGAINVFHDTTALKRAEAALAAHQEMLEQLVEERTQALVRASERLHLADRMAAVGTLAAGLAHDMKNVLMPLRMRLDAILAAPNLPPQATAELAAVVALLDHLRAMANNLSLFAKDPAQEGSEGRTDLGRWSAQVRGFIDASIGPAVTVVWETPEGIPPVGIAPHRLTQAVLNLVHNARDAILAGERPANATGGCGRILVAAGQSEAGQSVWLRISDTGCGMSEEVRRRCLEPFFTTKDRPSGAGGPGGSGLGLSTAHAIIERVGGEMEIQSRVGEGTVVTLLLPLAPEAETEPADLAAGAG